jgi:hypothetical protein
MPDWDAYREAYNRGLLTGDKKILYEEAVKRGLTGQTPETLPEIFRPVGGTYESTGEISTIHGKPIKKFVGMEQPEAGFGTLMKSSFVDDPEIKKKIFAESRGIPESQYRTGAEGNIEFQTPSGGWQREVSELPLSKVKLVGAETVAHPGSYLAPAGVLVGPWGPPAGAAAGEVIRKGIGTLVYGEKRKPLSDLLDIGLQAGGALTGEAVGKALGYGVNRYLGRSAGALRKAGTEIVKAELTPQEHAQALVLQTIARSHGIELAPHQLYDKKGMTNIWQYLREHPATSDSVQVFEKNLAQNSNEAIEKFIQQMGGRQKTPYTLGKEVQGAAEGAIEAATKKRSRLAGRIYKKAFEENPEVDVKPIIDFIETEAGSAKGPIYDSLQAAKKLLMKPDLPKKSPAGQLVDEFGNPLTPATVSYDTSLQGLHHSKMALDDLIAGARQTGIGNTSKRNLVRIKEMLLKQMKEASPAYEAARIKFEKLSRPIDRFRESVIGEIADLGKDPAIAKIPQKLLSIGSMPDELLLREARQAIEKKNPEIWKQLVGEYIRDTYDHIKTTQEGKVFNIAGKLKQKLFGSPEQQRLMRAAMDPADYQNYSNLMLVFERAAIGTATQSKTAPFLAMDRALNPQFAAKTEELIAEPRRTAAKWLVKKMDDIMMHGEQGKIFDALRSPDVVRKLERMKRLSPRSQNFIDELSVLTALIGEKSTHRRP